MSRVLATLKNRTSPDRFIADLLCHQPSGPKFFFICCTSCVLKIHVLFFYQAQSNKAVIQDQMLELSLDRGVNVGNYNKCERCEKFCHFLLCNCDFGKFFSPTIRWKLHKTSKNSIISKYSKTNFVNKNSPRFTDFQQKSTGHSTKNYCLVYYFNWSEIFFDDFLEKLCELQPFVGEKASTHPFTVFHFLFGYVFHNDWYNKSPLWSLALGKMLWNMTCVTYFSTDFQQ